MKHEELKSLYEKANEQVEKCSQIINSIAIRCLLPCVLLPKFITSFYAYFITNLGSNGFDLPFSIV